MQMHLSSDVQIPDGLLAANALLAENSRRGSWTYSGTLHQGFEVAISSTSLGIIDPLYDGDVRSRCTGKERDAESGLDYFGARYYASNMGRWMSPDLINVTEERLMNPSSTLNKYAYAANNPLKYVDPDGQDITYFYDQGGAAGHAVLFAYNQATGDSAIESFGPASKSVGTRAAEIGLFQVPATSMFDMLGKDGPKSAQDLRDNYSSLTIQTTPELAQQVIDYIRQNPDPATWGVLGPNCSSEVWKILRRFKLAGPTVAGGKTPKIIWGDLSNQQLFHQPVTPIGGLEYGHSRCGTCMFDFLWNSLPQSHPNEHVHSHIVPDSIKPVDNPQ
jgi:RHS repeat-associated protein